MQMQSRPTFFFLDSPSIAFRCITLSLDDYKWNTVSVIDLDTNFEMAVTDAKWT